MQNFNESWKAILSKLGLTGRKERGKGLPFRPRSLRSEDLERRIVLSGNPLVDGDAVAGYQDTAEGEPAQDLVAFAKALDAVGVKMYSASWCSTCEAQKSLFEDGAKYLPFIEVTNSDQTRNQIGIDENITVYPTWVFPDETRAEGLLSLSEIATRSGVAIPTGEDPIFDTISDQTLYDNSPLHIPLDGYDPNGGTLTYTVEVSNPSLFDSATIMSGNRSMQIDVAGYGTMILQLFESQAPRATSRIIELAEDGFYDGIIFHRVIDDFMIQGGDPTGTGSGGSTLGDFDDQFNVDLTHNQAGVLSMAKSGDDTNDSQFFITEVPTRWLDFQHTVFGQLVEGFDVLYAISETEVTDPDNSDYTPTHDVTMQNVDIITDVENGVLFLKAKDGVTGTSDVTVTVTDEDDNTYQQTFTVTVAADPYNGGAFLADLQDQYTTTVNTPLQIQVNAIDPEGDAVYFDQPTSTVYSIDHNTGMLTVTPEAGFIGPISVTVGVQQPLNQNDPYDAQTFTVNVAPEAPTGIDLLSTSDSGAADDDNITNLEDLSFLVTGVTTGALVNLYAGTTLIGSGTATDTSITITTSTLAVLGDGEYTITATQTLDNTDDDTESTESAASPTLTLTYDTDGPGPFSSTAPTEVVYGQVYTYDAETSDEGDAGVVYSLDGAPTGMTIDPDTGEVSWTPTNQQFGDHSFDIVVVDAAGNEDRQSLTVTVDGDLPIGDDTYTTDEDVALTVDAPGILANDGDDVSGTLTATIVDAPQHGTITFPGDGSFVYTPAADYNGTDTFTYRVTDDVRTSDPATVTITINAVNDVPVGEADTYVVGVNDSLEMDAAGGVLANDEDVEGDTLTASLVTGPEHGTLDLNADGSFEYTPTTDFAGDDTFTYKINDGTADSEPVTVTIHVNDSPTAVVDGPYTVDEDTVLTVDTANSLLGNDTDPESDSLTAVLITDAEHGSVTVNADGSFTYTPNEDFFGTDTFSYAANDGFSNSAPVTISITVNPISDPPTAVDDTYTVSEDAVLTITAATGVMANDFDVDDAGETLTATLVANPSHGTLVFNADGSFTYTPAADYFGTDTFTYKINDGTADSDTATVTISVANVNDAPTATNDTYTTNEDVPLTVTAANGVLKNDTDIDGDTLSAVLVTAPQHGNLTLNANGSFTYTPAANYNGTDTFTYRASDDDATSGLATVTLTITAVNDVPVGVADTYTVNEDTTLTVTAANGVLKNDTDVEGDTLTAVKTSSPSHGTLTFNSDGSFTYVPTANYSGTDSFTYSVGDGDLDSNDVTVTVTITSVNDPPNAVDDTATVDMNTSNNEIDVLANDTITPDTGETLTVTAVGTGSQGGTLTIINSGAKVKYTPATDFYGTETFTYTVSDGNGGTDTGTLTITVNESQPNSLTGFVYIDSDNDGVFDSTEYALPGITIQLTGTDNDGNSVNKTAVTDEDGAYKFEDLARGTYTITEIQPYGMIDGKDTVGSITATVGADKFSGIALTSGDDGTGFNFGERSFRAELMTIQMFLASTHPFEECIPTLLELGDQMYNQNTAPVAVADTYNATENTTLTVTAANGVLKNDTDANGDTLTAVKVTGPSHGTLTLNADGSFIYVPTADYFGTDSFTYKLSDGRLASNTVTVTLNIASDTPTAPTAAGDSYQVTKNTTLTVSAANGVLKNDTDVNNDTLTAVKVADPTHGTLTLNSNGSFTYVPTTDYTGTDSFTYKASDGTLQSSTVTVTLTISAPAAPVATADTYSVVKDSTLTVTAANGVLKNDTDANSDTLTAVKATNPSHGTLTLNSDGSFTYTPTTGYTGTDTFTYKASDGSLQSSAATVTLTVTASGTPVASPDSYSVSENQTLSVTAANGVLKNDTDPNSDTLTAVKMTNPSHGTLTLNSDGSFVYVPTADYHGTDSFTYKASDGTLQSSSMTVTITVNSDNDAPEADNDTYSVNEDNELVVTAANGVLHNDSDDDEDTLTAVLVAGPSHGDLTLNSDGSFSYEPDANYHGADTFTYKANDTEADSNVATVTITVNSINDVPLAVADSYDAVENQALVVSAANGLLANDSDVDGDTMIPQVVTLPAHGTVSVNDNGSFTYTPNTNYSGLDSFTYRVSDGTANSAAVTVSIDVGGVNQAPEADPDSYNLNEDETLTVTAANGVLANDTDADSDPLTAVLVTGPTHGNLTLNPAGSFVYTPAANYHGTDSFTYKASDGNDQSTAVTVTLTIAAINDAPTAVADSYSVVQNATLTVDAPGLLANDSDADDDTLTIQVVQDVQHGTLTMGTGGAFTYVPTSDYVGQDTFTYKLSDGTTVSNTVTVTINVTDTVEDLAQVTLQTTDTAGTAISSIAEGQSFVLEVYVQDLRSSAQGIFSAYMDVLFNSDLVTVGTITHGEDFGGAPHGDTDTDGLLNEVGSLAPSLTPTGGGDKLLFSVTFTADDVGTASFISRMNDLASTCPWSLYGLDTALTAPQIAFGSVDLEIVAAGSGEAEGEPLVAAALPSIPADDLSSDPIEAEIQGYLEATDTILGNWDYQPTQTFVPIQASLASFKSIDLRTLQDLAAAETDLGSDLEAAVDSLLAVPIV